MKLTNQFANPMKAGALLIASATILAAQPEFVPFSTFLERTESASSMHVRGANSKVKNAGAFDEMRGHILSMYRGVSVSHSFIKDSSHFDCVPVEQQPALRVHGITKIAEAPPRELLAGPEAAAETAAAVAEPETVDAFGNAVACDAGSFPMRRLTLEEMTQWPTLRHFFAKKPETPSEAPAVASASHKYAFMSQHVDNLGGNSNIALWNPYVNTALGEVFSLSQAWYAGGDGAATQTAEVGWQTYPARYGANSVLFIYYTADYYATTGCYNLDCPAFVQIAGAGMLGASLGTPSQMGGAQREFSARFQLFNGNWWLAINGTWIGYYPGALYRGGQLTRYAENIQFGTESVASTIFPPQGSGAWSTSGWSQAAYQRNVFYSDTAGTLRWSSLQPANPSPSCYSVSGPYSSSSQGWGVYFFAGGPGGSGC